MPSASAKRANGHALGLDAEPGSSLALSGDPVKCGGRFHVRRSGLATKPHTTVCRLVVAHARVRPQTFRHAGTGSSREPFFLRCNIVRIGWSLMPPNGGLNDQNAARYSQ
jgi:hypothetical protein